MAPPQFPHYRWRGLPKVVQQQLYRLGVGAAECVLCGARQHGCYDCPQRSSPNGWAMWQAWERWWLLLQAKELEIYALSGTEGEYLRRSGAVFARSVVTRAVVAQFRWPAAQNCNEGPHARVAFPTKECAAESGSLQPTSAACAGHFTTPSESSNANEAAAAPKTSSSASAKLEEEEE